MMYPGKTLVFLSSIDGIRRLHPIFSQLNLGQVSVLHSSMQQKARMKSMERSGHARAPCFVTEAHYSFQEADHAILLATDVASRGLDIPKVDHVVHFQLPRTSDTYIHRSGRTGRAGQSGVTLQLVAPEEKGLQREIMQSLGKGKRVGPLRGGHSKACQTSKPWRRCPWNGASSASSRPGSTWRGRSIRTRTRSRRNTTMPSGWKTLPRPWKLTLTTCRQCPFLQ
jgi:superfamily II DNA/RNA helicase